MSNVRSLDAADRAILLHLSQEGRLSNAELAALVGLSPAVRSTMRRDGHTLAAVRHGDAGRLRNCMSSAGGRTSWPSGDGVDGWFGEFLTMAQHLRGGVDR
ncbi:AsnC family protein [Streptomyces yanii]|uniref:AsnC family protein n=1 Tax=Streptomyces yanii TaxID=78510 RepID=A0ABV5RG35_9ACTN